MNNAPFVMEPHLTGLAQMYSNESYIADEVLPRTPVNNSTYKYTKFNKRDRFHVPETRVGRTGRVNEVEFGGTQASGFTKEEGLESPIPQADINAAVGQPISPLDTATTNLSELIALGREQRVAALVFAAATYPTGNKVTLSGTSQWSDYTNSDPINAILTTMDTMMVRPNTLVLGQAVWTKLRMHPKIAKAIHGNSGDTAIAKRREVAELLEIEQILVGKAWNDTANAGQTASYARLWGKHCSMLYTNKQALSSRGVTFGGTFQWGERVSGTRQDPDIGLYGGIRVRVGESLDESVVASDAGYFFENAVA